MFKGLNKYFSGITKNTILLAFASLFADISTEMLYPILPIFLTEVLKSGGSVVGIIEGVAVATQNIVQGFSGWLADKLKKKKAIALSGYFFAAISKPLMGMSGTWQEVLGGRFLDRFGTAMRSAPRDALIAGSVSKENRGKAFGLEGIGDNLGAFLGPLLAILLFSLMHINIRYIFYYAVIPGLLAFLMILLVKDKSSQTQSKIKLTFKTKSFPSVYWKYLGVTALFDLGNSSNAFLILQTHSIGASLKLTVFIYAGFNLVAALISYPAGFLSDVTGRKNILLISFLIFILTYFGFAFSHNLMVIGILFVFYGLYQGIYRATGKALAIDFSPSALHASGIGWYSATNGLLQLTATIVAGLLWDHVSHQTVFIYGALFAIAGSIALILLIPKKYSLEN